MVKVFKQSNVYKNVRVFKVWIVWKKLIINLFNQLDRINCLKEKFEQNSYLLQTENK